jgi:hypothetical protein
MLLRKIGMTGKPPVVALVFTGRLLMRISALMACFVERQPPKPV